MRYVIVGTLQGAVNPHQPLDDYGQWVCERADLELHRELQREHMPRRRADLDLLRDLERERERMPRRDRVMA